MDNPAKQNIMSGGKVRLQKFLAERGCGSRRACEQYIQDGFVKVNGARAELGMSVDPRVDEVEFKGRRLMARPPACRTIILHKPRGYQCTAANATRTVYDLLPSENRALLIAGRLDKDSEGLLLMSNDGGLVQRLTHPRYGCVKTYHVTLSGTLNDDVLRRLREPLDIDGYRTRPAVVRYLKAGTHSDRFVLEFRLGEGRNRQVRRLCERAGLQVHRLVRNRIGNLSLAGLRPGQWREITPAELARQFQD